MTSDLTNLFIYFILFVIIVFQFLDKGIEQDRAEKQRDKLLEELSKAIKAVISKNANEYVMTASIDKVQPEKNEVLPSDEIPEESLNDDEFFEAIEKTNRQK